MKSLLSKTLSLLFFLSLFLWLTPVSFAAATPQTDYNYDYIIIPSGITIIEDEAFAGCVSATYVYISEGVKNIGSRAFANSSVEYLVLPASVERIGERAFENTPIKAVAAPRDSYGERWAKVNGFPLYILENPASDFEYTIDDGECTITKYIGIGKNVIIPSQIAGCDVTVIGSRSFSPDNWENGITSVVIPKTVRRIEMYAFSYTDLTDIIIPEGVIEMDQGAFAHAYKLRTIRLPSTLKSIGPRNFRCCTSLERYEIPDTITRIEAEAFSECTGLKEIVIPNSVTEIESGAFTGCTNLDTIVIPSSVTEIGNSVFSCCSNLSKFTIHNSVTSIGSNAFSYCTSLTEIAIPASVTSIGDYAFAGCSKLSAVVIPDSVKEIGWSAFSNCTGLTSVKLSNSLTELADNVFEDCSSLTSIMLPGSVTKIGWSVFRNCSCLNTITIPGSVTEISSYAFDGCSQLKNVYFRGTSAKWASITFGDGNDCIKNATIRFTEDSPNVGNGRVAFLNKWDRESGELGFYSNNLLYFADDSIRGLIPQMIHKYVYFEYEEKTGELGYFINSIQTVTSIVGQGEHVTKVTNVEDGFDYLTSITIDGTQYQVQPNTIIYWSNWFDAHRPVLSHFNEDGFVVGLSVLEGEDGVLRDWIESENKVVLGTHTVRHDDYYLSTYVDLPFLTSLEAHFGTPVRFYTDKGAPTEPVVLIDYIESGDEPVYRALLIGNSNYSKEPLVGPENSVRFMKAMLKRTASPFIVVDRLDVNSNDDLYKLISLTFADATNNDTSLFYFEGHGSSGELENGEFSEQFKGDLGMINGSSFGIQSLMNSLSQIPGEVFVILDSCLSGRAIPNEESCKKSSLHVLTAADRDEDSYTTHQNDSSISGGLMTEGIAEGIGISFLDCVYNGSMPADYNHDNVVSFGEIADYTKGYAFRYPYEEGKGPQHVQSYPAIEVRKPLEAPDVIFFQP